MRYEIVCTIKPDRFSPHERITAVGISTQTLYIDDVINWIDNGIHSFYTKVNGKEAEVYVVREKGKRPYLRTGSDGYFNDNLLALGTCSLPPRH